MESMDEILDLDELQEGILDDTLKDFMVKDEQAAKLLKEKIDELNNEGEKLSQKEEEIKSLEESNREKISSNASPDELIEIAGKLKEAESELSKITDNIKKLESEREELIETKNNIEKSKQEYIKNLNSTNSDYDEQMKKISEAIEVCDNPTLKQVLNDVKLAKEKELAVLQEKRNSELKTVLNDVKKQPDFSKLDQDMLNDKIDINSNNEINKDTVQNNNDKVILDVVNNYPILDDAEEKVDIPANDSSDLINLGSILSNVEIKETNDSIEKPSLNNISVDDLVLPDVNISDYNNQNKVKIIFEKNVPNALLKEIFTSSRIMPVLYDYLDNKGGSLI
ncbi:MAG: hypothetical protein J6B64_03975 [Bacilli bacterium]|nr:hypothetical protein [Bacilli bacterium]MBP3635450.1 hypothetical protein [Bacilli bacterium]